MPCRSRISDKSSGTNQGFSCQNRPGICGVPGSSDIGVFPSRFALSALHWECPEWKCEVALDRVSPDVFVSPHHRNKVAPKQGRHCTEHMDNPFSSSGAGDDSNAFVPQHSAPRIETFPGMHLVLIGARTSGGASVANRILRAIQWQLHRLEQQWVPKHRCSAQEHPAITKA